MNITKFSKNWNNKLGQEYYSTYRILTSKYKIGDIHQIMVGNKVVHTAEVVDILPLRVSHLTNKDTLNDAGLILSKFKGLLNIMYVNKIQNYGSTIEDCPFGFVTFKKITPTFNTLNLFS